MTQNNQLLTGPYWYRGDGMTVAWSFYFLHESRVLFWANSRGVSQDYVNVYFEETVYDSDLFHKAPLLMAKLYCPQVFYKRDDASNT